MFLDIIAAAHAHTEAYIALINSALPGHGDKRQFALSLGISPEYFSNLRNRREDISSYARTPGPELAKKIANALPLDREQRESLLEHMDYVWEWEQSNAVEVGGLGLGQSRFHQIGVGWHERRHSSTALGKVRLLDRPMTDLLTDVGQARETATSTQDPSLAKQQYRVIRIACQLMLKRIDASKYPIEYARVCLLLHDTVCVLNRADEGVYYARLAREIVDNLEPGRYRDNHQIEKADLDHLRVNVIVAQCLAYRNLNLSREAYRVSLEAEEVLKEIGSYEAKFWARHIYEHRLKALSNMPRFTQDAISGLARQARDAYERQFGALTAHAELRISEAEARGYLQYGTQRSIKRAWQLLRDQVEGVHSIRELGPVHKTHLVRTYAMVLWKQKELDEWKHYIQLALGIALEAGLDHQLADAKREYGPNIVPIIDALMESE